MAIATKRAYALIPVKRVLEAEHVEGSTIEAALRDLLSKDRTPRLEPVYMPGVIDGRNAYSPNEAPVNWRWLTTPSIKATGKTKAGTPIVVYAHVPNHFSNPDNIATAVGQGLVNGAGIMPQYEFQRLVELAEEQQGKPNQRVFLADYKALKRAPSDGVAVNNALKHPQTIPFLGGRARAEQYLPRHEKFLGKQIGIWHVDDLTEQASIGRVLRVGFDYYSAFFAGDSLSAVARFVGVPRGAEGAAPQMGLEQTISTLNGLLAPAVVEAARQRLKEAGYR